MIKIIEPKQIDCPVWVFERQAETAETEKYIQEIRQAHNENKYLEERIGDMAFALVVALLFVLFMMLGLAV